MRAPLTFKVATRDYARLRTEGGNDRGIAIPRGYQAGKLNRRRGTSNCDYRSGHEVAGLLWFRLKKQDRQPFSLRD